MSRGQLAIIFAGFLFCLLSVLYFSQTFYKIDGLRVPYRNNIPLYKEEAIRSELPARLKIPGLGIDVPVEHVGLTPEGTMGVPKGPTNVAWLNLGSRPGEVGSAVIAGHRGWKNNQEAVFDDLHKLRKGDDLYIETVAGRSIHFVVREIRVYDSDSYAPEVFSSSDGAHLNLVTCTGIWDIFKKSSTERLVVFSDILD
ncbi:MAG: class F sortase [bacterium]|nr:class F sortase [bacterium]